MKPVVWLGAPAPGRLALPDAMPSASRMYAPRGVFFDDDYLIVADSGNHRVLIWHGLPARDGQAADVVIGQTGFEQEGPNAAGRGPENGLHLPTGVAILDGRLFVADAWHHRILYWNRVPQQNGAPPDGVIGQNSLGLVEPNRGGCITAASLYWPYGFGRVGGRFYVADTGNRRLLGWPEVPERDEPAQLILGQDSAGAGDDNRGGEASAKSFRWPHAVAGDDRVLYVADAGDHRVLGWSPAPVADDEANVVLGQENFRAAAEFPYAPQGPRKLRFPYSVASDGETLAVADTANNRILLWGRLPLAYPAPSPDHVIGQDSFEGNGENRWKAVTPETLCWPYGIWLHRGMLAIADSGNNRVMIWAIERSSAPRPGVEADGRRLRRIRCVSLFQDRSNKSSMRMVFSWAG